VLTVTNTAPSANAGADQTIAEGDSLTLAGTGSDASSADNAGLTFAWDLDNDGLYDDLLTAGGTLTWTQLQGLGINNNGTYTLKLQVSDDHTATVDSMVLTVLNTPPSPTITGIPVGHTSPEGTTFNLGSLTGDPASPADAPYTYLWHVTQSEGQVIADGSGPTFSFTPDRPGTYSVQLTVWDKDGAWGTTTTGDITVTHVTFRVIQFTPTASGFEAKFNRPAQLDVLNLYYGQTTHDHLPDLVVTRDDTVIRGSMAWNAATQTASWVKTGGVLTPGTYEVTLASRLDGWVDFRGEVLDGNSDNTIGDDFYTTMTVDPIAAPVVSLPDVCRGPGQPVNIPATGSGLPIRISEAAGVTDVGLTLTYDPAVLSVTGAGLASGMAGWTVTPDLSVAGRVVLTAAGPALPAGVRALFTLTASVPAEVRYGASEVLVISSLQVKVDGSPVDAVADRAFHKVAFVGDTTGNRGYSGLDASLISRVTVNLDTGFDAYPWADPGLVGDATGDGMLTSLDASYVARRSVGLSTPQIPPLPAGNVTTLPQGGLDPIVRVASNVVAKPGGIVHVPVTIDGPPGVQTFGLQFRYDTRLLDLGNAGVKLSGLTAEGWGLVVNVDDAAGVVRVTGIGTSPMAIGTGQILDFAFQVPSTAKPGKSRVTVAATSGGGLNEGAMPITPISGSVVVKPKTPAKPVPVAKPAASRPSSAAKPVASQPQGTAKKPVAAASKTAKPPATAKTRAAALAQVAALPAKAVGMTLADLAWFADSKGVKSKAKVNPSASPVDRFFAEYS